MLRIRLLTLISSTRAMQFFGVFVPVSAGIRIKSSMQNVDPEHGMTPDAELALYVVRSPHLLAAMMRYLQR